MDRSPDARRIWNVVVLPGLAVLIVIGMGIGAVQITRYFQRSAEGVLRDYTTLAADRIVQNLEIGLARSLYPLINAEYTALVATDWAPSSRVLQATRAAPVPAAHTVDAIFVWRPQEAPVAWPPNASFNSPERSPESWAAELNARVYFALDFVDHDRLIIYDVERSGDTVELAYGIVLRTDSVRSTIANVMREAVALPEHVTEDVPGDSVYSVVVTSNSGVNLFERALAATLPYTVTRGLRSPPGVTVDVALTSDLSTRLVHGGPPSGSGWVFGGLAVLAIFLVASAALLWYQDRRLSLLRDQFIAGVSHELRTPLAQIRLFAETLALGRVRDEGEIRQAHRVVEQETRRLSHLVENLLLFSRYEGGYRTLHLTNIDLAQLVSDIVEEFAPLALAENTSVISRVTAGIRADVDADAVRQMLLNLLDNAVKYGRVGQTVNVSLEASGNDVVLAVEDEGPGIPAEYTKKIWQRFWRSPIASSTGKGGSGIGLTVVRELAEQHGGSVTVEPGRGARFVIRLPRHVARD